MLTIVPTPIGNLEDITLRAIKVLQSMDAIICEDTRRTSILLNHYNIKKPLIVLNDFNETNLTPQIILKLHQGENLALVSDAGTPLISDPGFKLIKECINQNLPIDSLPGPSALITALTLSGIPPDKFLFLGFLPDRPSNRQKVYLKIKVIKTCIKLTYIIFVSPFKLTKTLGELSNNFGDIEVTLTKELTKIHQNVETYNISAWLDKFKSHPKGEWVLLFNL